MRIVIFNAIVDSMLTQEGVVMCLQTDETGGWPHLKEEEQRNTERGQ